MRAKQERRNKLFAILQVVLPKPLPKTLLNPPVPHTQNAPALANNAKRLSGHHRHLRCHLQSLHLLIAFNFVVMWQALQPDRATGASRDVDVDTLLLPACTISPPLHPPCAKMVAWTQMVADMQVQ